MQFTLLLALFVNVFGQSRLRGNNDHSLSSQFDDTFHWHNCVFDGLNIPIESFSDLISRPTTDIILMSLTFEDIIKKKLQKTFGKEINITSLKKLITKVK